MNDMPDDGNPNANQLSRIGESVAELRGRTAAQFDALKEDTASLRSQSHELRAAVQEVVAVALAGQAAIKGHMAECERRAARMEKLAFIILTATIAALGFLIVPYLHAATAIIK